MFEKITENWVLKLVSLTFALILWFFVMGERKLEVGYSVPLEVENLPPGLMIASDLPNTIDVRISGPRTILMNLHPRDMSISVDLEGLSPGTTSFRRLEERLNLPSGLRVTRVSPSAIEMRLERVRQKRVPVEPVLTGTPGEGYRISDVLVTPGQVAIEGAESELREISRVATAAIDIEGLREDHSLTVPLNFHGNYTTLLNHGTVEIQITVEEVRGGF
jgi:YbbR domain-containing protein